MESGNSGSLQSSSGGGDEEYDSLRHSVAGAAVDSFNSLLHSVSSAAASSPLFFDTLSYLDNFSRSPPPPPPSLAPSSSRNFHQSPSELQYTTAAAPCTALQSISTAAQQTEAAAAVPYPAASTPPRGSKKRTRASRRAPTTVLTTDTTNFRSMVQEFTGTPSPPFSFTAIAGGGMSFPRSRLDLSNSSGFAAVSSPPYLLRSFPNKQPYNSSPINSSTPLISPPTTATAFTSNLLNARMHQTPSNDNNYPLQSDLMAMQTQNPSSNDITGTSFQSLLQSTMPPTTTTAGCSSHAPLVPASAADFGSVHLAGELPVTAAAGLVTRWPGLGDGDSSRRSAAPEVCGAEKVSDAGGTAAAAPAPSRSEGMIESWFCSSD